MKFPKKSASFGSRQFGSHGSLAGSSWPADHRGRFLYHRYAFADNNLSLDSLTIGVILTTEGIKKGHFS
jgi:hypothetical protein